MAWGPFGWLANQITGNKPIPAGQGIVTKGAGSTSPWTNPTTMSSPGITGTNINPSASAMSQYGITSPTGVLGAYTYGSGGAGSPSVDTTGLQDNVRNQIGAIQQAYASLQGNINPYVQDKVNQYLQNYDAQTQGLNKSYGNAVGQTQNIYGARGLGDSSYLGNALDEASGTYNQNLSSINQDKSSKLGALGSYAQGLTSSAKSASDQYGQYLGQLGQYSPADLTSLSSTLGSALPGIQQQAAGIGTNQDFLNTLNNYAPQANQGSSQLASKLQQLVTSSAPIFAKNQIASGLVKSAQLTDPNAQNYWQNYYQTLLNGG